MKDISLLGKKVKDIVTGFTGIATSVTYDLYGCVMSVVTPIVNDAGKIEDGKWFDTKRLEVLSNEPVMAVPTFGDFVEVAGGQEKSLPPSGPR